MRKKSNEKKSIEQIEKILHAYNIPWDEDISYRICLLLNKAEDSCKKVVQDVLKNDRFRIEDYMRNYEKYIHAEEIEEYDEDEENNV